MPAASRYLSSTDVVVTSSESDHALEPIEFRAEIWNSYWVAGFKIPVAPTIQVKGGSVFVTQGCAAPPT